MLENKAPIEFAYKFVAGVVIAAFSLKPNDIFQVAQLLEHFASFQAEQLYHLGIESKAPSQKMHFEQYFGSLNKYESSQLLYYITLSSQMHNIPL